MTPEGFKPWQVCECMRERIAIEARDDVMCKRYCDDWPQCHQGKQAWADDKTDRAAVNAGGATR